MFSSLITTFISHFLPTPTQSSHLLSVSLLFTTLGISFLFRFVYKYIAEWQVYVVGAGVGFGYTLSTLLLQHLFTYLSGIQFSSLSIRSSFFWSLMRLGGILGPFIGAIVYEQHGMHVVGLVSIMLVRKYNK